MGEQSARRWILTETKLRASILQHQYRDNSAFDDVDVRPAHDALISVFHQLDDHEPFSTAVDSVVLLSDDDSEALLGALIHNENSQFPMLRAATSGGRDGETVVTSALSEIRSFVDSVRRYQTSDALIRSVIDEFGDARADRKRSEELVLLLDAYEELQSSCGRFDRLAVLGAVLARLESERFREVLLADILPESIELDHVSQLFPLECAIWNRIAQLVSLTIVLPEHVTPGAEFSRSKRYLLPLAKYQESGILSAPVVQAPFAFRDREPIANFLFDGSGAAVPQVQGVGVLSCDERRDEVVAAARMIRSAISKGAAEASDFHLVVLDLDAYYPILKEEFQSHGVPLSIPRGERLSVSSIYGAFSALCRWFENQTPTTLAEFFAHPLVENVALTEEILEDFFAENSWFEPLLRQNLKGFLPDRKGSYYEHLHQHCGFSSFRLDAVFVEKLFSRMSLQDRDFSSTPNWVRPVLQMCLRGAIAADNRASYRDLSTAICNLALSSALYRDVRASIAENQSAASIGRAIVNEFQDRIVSPSREASERPEYKLKSLTRALEQTISNLELRRSLLRERDFGVASFTRVARRDLRSVFLSNEFDVRKAVATEFLDVRGMRDKYTIVIGANAENFPPPSTIESPLCSFFEDLSRRVRSDESEAQKTDQALWLISSLLQSSREVLFSFPRFVNGSETLATPFVRDLDSICKGDECSVLCSDVSVSDPITADDSPNDRAVQRAKQLFAARSARQFTEYDGVLGANDNDSRGNGYSPTALEMLRDCPHRYFFARVLRLEEAEASFVEQLQLRLGNIVHRALEVFFKPGSGELAVVSSDTFDECCRRLQRIALVVFDEDEIDWDAHPVLESAKSKVLLGLDRPGDVSRRGYLKAALVYQRDLLGTLPTHVEYHFKEPGVIVSDGERQVCVSGKIDRVDLLQAEDEQGFVVWDYKTSKRTVPARDVVSGKSLQLPLYAMAVQQLIEPNNLPVRGGCLMLGEPNRRDEDLSSPTKGVAIEHLAVRINGRKTELDSSAVAERVEVARRTVLDLDDLVQTGALHQVAETERCPVCEFRRICARNEANLEAKLAKDTAENPAPEAPFHNVITDVAETPDVSTACVPRLSSEQELAVDPTKSISLLAGAGSGKTMVLQSRVMKLILKGDPVESIVAITFTEKAALEVRTRVERAIDVALRSGECFGEKLSANERELLGEAKAELPRTQISTIHSLAGRIVAMNPVLAGLPFERQVATGGLRRQLLERAFEAVVAAQGSSVNNAVAGLLDSGISFTVLRNEVFSLVSKPLELAALQRGFVEKEFALDKTLDRVNEALRSETREKLQAFLEEWLSEVAKWRPEAEGAGVLSEKQSSDFVALEALARELKHELEQEASNGWLDCVVSLVHFLKENKSSAKRKGAKGNPRNLWKELADTLAKLSVVTTQGVIALDVDRESQAVALGREVIQLAGAVANEYAMLKTQHQVVDFDDLIHGAHRALCGEFDEELREEQTLLRERVLQQCRHVMVDEFQDTDAMQWDIIRQFIGPAEAGRTVFLVGDGKQAIYGFRGGDIRVFDAATAELMERGGSELTLENNYRSSADVLSFVNDFFSKLLPVDFASDGQPRVETATPYQPMRSAYEEKESSHDAVTTISVPYPRGGHTDSNEAEHIADFIANISRDVAKGESASWPQLVDKAASGKPLVAVLTRTVRQLLAIADALEVLEVPFAISHSSGFYDLEEIVQIENLLRAFSRRGEDIATVGLLRSALVGLSDRELEQLHLEIGRNWSVLFDSRRSTETWSALAQEVATTLRRWKGFAMLNAPSAFVSAVLIDCDAQRAYTETNQEPAFRNMQRFVDRLRQGELNGEFDPRLSEAVRWLDFEMRSGGSAPQANVTDSPVLLTTVHGAKGLEFPMVVLPFLNGSRARYEEFVVGKTSDEDDEPVLTLSVEDPRKDYRRSRTLLSQAVAKRNAMLHNSEERRIFYVACTRAEDYLVLPLREERDHQKSQAGISALSEKERCEIAFESDRPAVWLRHLTAL